MSVCDHCGSCFKTPQLLKLHLNVHKDAQFKCTHCSKLFRKKSNLKYHLKSNHQLGPSIKKYKCDTCERFFMTNRNLRKHITKNICSST